MFIWLEGFVCYKNEPEFEKERDKQVSSMRQVKTKSKGIEGYQNQEEKGE